MRPGSWLLLLAPLLSASALAQARPGEANLQRRVLVTASRSEDTSPLELHVRAHAATRILFEPPLRPGSVKLETQEERLQFLPSDDGALVVIPLREPSEGERMTFTVETEPGAAPLRFELVFPRDTMDLWVRVVHAKNGTSEEDAAVAIARQLLSAPGAQATLAVPQKMGELETPRSRGEVESLLWMGPRFFITLTVRNRKTSVPPWRLVQARMRTTLPDGVILEWPAQFYSRAPNGFRQRHVVTSQMPEGAHQLELALDSEDAPGDFQPIAQDEARAKP
ncbi:DUF2381 family protein [Melittangium boletus]|uniref:DUF2381 family protein n=1 Tax=Melittangium boletus DSM 14713 TaxID=1294270 RepID=A0A250I8H1_9BACT|nr:DUF2381 family protein [Melittangium boletus]ATB27452.1 hypothetical protein MEBOL_000894 [Melittangium boletus DSM 14713]